jgi:hypothetical protein
VDYEVTGPIIAGQFGGPQIIVQIAAGEPSATVTVTPMFQPAVEGAETIVVTAEGTSGTITIADEPAAMLTVADATATELGGDPASFTVTRGGPAGYAREVVVTLGGTATRSVDYEVTGPIIAGQFGGPQIIVRIAPGEPSATVTVTPMFQPAVEGAETIVVTAEGSSETITIADSAQ